MKHEIASLNTKHALSAALKELMNVKPLSKITVSELIRICEVNRKTFYYHFRDIYDLLNWTLQQEAVNVVKQFDLLVNFEDAIIFVLDYVEKNKHILACAYDSMGREQLKSFLANDFNKIVGSYIDNVEKKNGLHVNKDFKEQLTFISTGSLAGMLLELITKNVKMDRNKSIKYISLIATAALPPLLKAAEEKL